MDITDVARRLAQAETAIAAATAIRDTLRTHIETELREQYAATGDKAGPHLDDVTIDLEPQAPAAVVTDDAALAEWVKTHHPTEATATIVLDNPAHLTDALDALEFADIPATITRVEVRPAYLKNLLTNLDPGPDGGAVETNTTTGETVDVPGIAWQDRPARVVVRKLAAAKSAAATAATTATLTALTGPTDHLDAIADTFGADDVQAAVTANAYPIPTDDTLEGMKVAQLKALAAAHGLHTGGNRADLVDKLIVHRQHKGETPA